MRIENEKRSENRNIYRRRKRRVISDELRGLIHKGEELKEKK